MTKREQILKAAEFKEFKYRADVETVALVQFEKGKSERNKELFPLITALAERVEMLEKVCKLVVNWNSTNQELEPKEVLFIYNNMVLKAQQALSASTAIDEILKGE